MIGGLDCVQVWYAVNVQDIHSLKGHPVQEEQPQLCNMIVLLLGTQVGWWLAV